MKTALAEVSTALEGHPEAVRHWLVGVPWFSPPQPLLDSLRATAERMEHHPYPAIGGEPSFRASVADFHTRSGLPLEADQVIATHGAKGGLLAVLGCLVEPGTEVLHPSPCYPAYPAMVNRFGGTPVAIGQPGGAFEWDPSTLEDRITHRTRALVLSSPANPTGATLGPEQAGTLVEACRRHGIRLVCDEAYDAFRRLADPAQLPSHHDPRLETVVTVRSFSKSHAVCGWRLGYIAADRAFADRVAAWQSAYLNPPNALVQLAAAAAVEAPRPYAVDVAHRVRRRLEDLARTVTRADLPSEPPAGGFYLWVDCRQRIREQGLSGSLDLCLDLVRRTGVGLWPGEDFMAPGWVRLSAVGISETAWTAALERLENALKRARNGD